MVAQLAADVFGLDQTFAGPQFDLSETEKQTMNDHYLREIAQQINYLMPFQQLRSDITIIQIRNPQVLKIKKITNPSSTKIKIAKAFGVGKGVI